MCSWPSLENYRGGRVISSFVLEELSLHDFHMSLVITTYIIPNDKFWMCLEVGQGEIIAFSGHRLGATIVGDVVILVDVVVHHG